MEASGQPPVEGEGNYSAAVDEQADDEQLSDEDKVAWTEQEPGADERLAEIGALDVVRQKAEADQAELADEDRSAAEHPPDDDPGDEPPLDGDDPEDRGAPDEI